MGLENNSLWMMIALTALVSACAPKGASVSYDPSAPFNEGSGGVTSGEGEIRDLHPVDDTIPSDEDENDAYSPGPDGVGSGDTDGDLDIPGDANDDSNAVPPAELPDESGKLNPAIRGFWESKKDGQTWTMIVARALAKDGQPLLNERPREVEQYCKNFDKLSKKGRAAFWVAMFSAIAYRESNWNPAVSYQEKFPDSDGNRVISRGLLQLSLESGRGYKCDFNTPEDVHDSKKNLECGVRIMNKWVTTHKTMVGNGKEGTAKYWGVMRKKSTREAIRKKMNTLTWCNQ